MKIERSIVRLVVAVAMLTTAATSVRAQEPTKAEAVKAEVAEAADSLRATPVMVVDSVQAARVDSLVKTISGFVTSGYQPDPTRALWLSLVLPGAGQIYNHKYWKLPIIYGGFLGCAYALNWNGQMLSDYSQAYLDIMDNDPNTKSYEKMLPLNYNISGREEQFKEIFKNKKNYYRKYRDMSIMAFAAVYALAVIDAYVDAELSSFDISEDLSMRVQPTMITPTQTTSDIRNHGLGLSFCLNF